MKNTIADYKIQINISQMHDIQSVIKINMSAYIAIMREYESICLEEESTIFENPTPEAAFCFDIGEEYIRKLKAIIESTFDNTNEGDNLQTFFDVVDESAQLSIVDRETVLCYLLNYMIYSIKTPCVMWAIMLYVDHATKTMQTIFVKNAIASVSRYLHEQYDKLNEKVELFPSRHVISSGTTHSPRSLQIKRATEHIKQLAKSKRESQ